MKFSLKFFLVFVLLIHVTAGFSIFAAYLPDFDEFKVTIGETKIFLTIKFFFQKTYKKLYSSKVSEARAFRNFVRNKKLVDDFNEFHAEEAGYFLRINKQDLEQFKINIQKT